MTFWMKNLQTNHFHWFSCKFKIEEAFPTITMQADDEFKSH